MTPTGRAPADAALAEAAALQKLEEEFDPEMRFRPLCRPPAGSSAGLLIVLSCFHYYTAGFGLLPETTHRGVHLAFVLGLIFLVFSARRRCNTQAATRRRCCAPLGIGLIDWRCAIAAVIACCTCRGSSTTCNFASATPIRSTGHGLDHARRAARGDTAQHRAGRCRSSRSCFMAYALAGPSFPGILAARRRHLEELVNHLYLTSQGIYGIAVGVVATYVFHFVLFGVLATRIGLGQLFIDIASAIAGRYAGGPAKVSYSPPALFGMISGSSVANAVTVGSLTIPTMIRLGYPRHFAGAVEAAARPAARSRRRSWAPRRS